MKKKKLSIVRKKKSWVFFYWGTKTIKRKKKKLLKKVLKLNPKIIIIFLAAMEIYVRQLLLHLLLFYVFADFECCLWTKTGEKTTKKNSQSWQIARKTKEWRCSECTHETKTWSPSIINPPYFIFLHEKSGH